MAHARTATGTSSRGASANERAERRNAEQHTAHQTRHGRRTCQTDERLTTVTVGPADHLPDNRRARRPSAPQAKLTPPLRHLPTGRRTGPPMPAPARAANVARPSWQSGADPPTRDPPRHRRGPERRCGRQSRTIFRMAGASRCIARRARGNLEAIVESENPPSAADSARLHGSVVPSSGIADDADDFIHLRGRGIVATRGPAIADGVAAGSCAQTSLTSQKSRCRRRRPGEQPARQPEAQRLRIRASPYWKDLAILSGARGVPWRRVPAICVDWPSGIMLLAPAATHLQAGCDRNAIHQRAWLPPCPVRHRQARRSRRRAHAAACTRRPRA